MSRELLQQALDALETIRRIEDLEYGSLSKSGKAVSAIRSELAKPELRNVTPAEDQVLRRALLRTGKRVDVQLAAHPPCSRHPDAPHGFDRTASHNADRYVCECESWVPGEAS